MCAIISKFAAVEKNWGPLMRQTKALLSSRAAPSRLDEIGAAVEVRRHPGARRLTLRVSRTKRAVIVTLPVQCDLDEAGSFLSRNIEWVRERLDSLPDAVHLVDGAVIPLRGVLYRIRVTHAANARTVTCQIGAPGTLPILCVQAPKSSARRVLKDWLFDEARGDLEKCVRLHENRLGVSSKRIAVRDQSTRWGSCSTTGVLSFSWRLVLAPPYVLDYVAAHEVAHLREMNHGPRFWALVERSMPAYHSAKHWLQIYGLDLHRYALDPA